MKTLKSLNRQITNNVIESIIKIPGMADYNAKVY
jgi:hypothetical protein